MTLTGPSAGMPSPFRTTSATRPPSTDAASRRRLLLSSFGHAMILLRLVIVCAAALLLQLTFFTEVRVVGVAPEMPALIAILAGLFAGAQNGSVIAFVVGLIWDLYLPTPIGLAALTFAVVAYALGDLTEELLHEKVALRVWLVFVGTVAMVSAYALLGAVLGQNGLITDRLWLVVLVSSLLNTVMSLLVAPAMRWALAIRSDTAFDRGGTSRRGARRLERSKPNTAGVTLSDQVPSINHRDFS